MSNYKGGNHRTPHTDESKQKISEKMKGNTNHGYDNWTLEAAIKLFEKAIDLALNQPDKNYFISTIAKNCNATRFQLDYLRREKYTNELKEYDDRLYNIIESNLFTMAAEKKISEKMATLALRNFFQKDWNNATSKQEIDIKAEQIVWHEIRNYSQPIIDVQEIKPLQLENNNVQSIDIQSVKLLDVQSEEMPF
jgi:hypothetical protein